MGPALDSPRGHGDRPWTWPVDVPVTMLAGFKLHAPTGHMRRKVTGEERLASLRGVRRFDPIEVAVERGGEAFRLLDGHHRLYVARQRGDATIRVCFLFAR